MDSSKTIKTRQMRFLWLFFYIWGPAKMDLGRHLPFHRRWRWKSADLCESFTTDWKVSRCSVGSKSYGLIEAKRSALSSTAITVVSVWPPPGRSTYFFLFDPTQKKRSVVGENPSRAQKEKKTLHKIKRTKWTRWHASSVDQLETDEGKRFSGLLRARKLQTV